MAFRRGWHSLSNVFEFRTLVDGLYAEWRKVVLRDKEDVFTRNMRRQIIFD